MDFSIVAATSSHASMFAVVASFECGLVASRSHRMLLLREVFDEEMCV